MLRLDCIRPRTGEHGSLLLLSVNHRIGTVGRQLLTEFVGTAVLVTVVVLEDEDVLLEVEVVVAIDVEVLLDDDVLTDVEVLLEVEVEEVVDGPKGTQVHASVQKPHAPPMKAPPVEPGSHSSSPSRMPLPQVAGRSVSPSTQRRSRTRRETRWPVMELAVARTTESGEQASAFIVEP